MYFLFFFFFEYLNTYTYLRVHYLAKYFKTNIQMFDFHFKFHVAK